MREGGRLVIRLPEVAQAVPGSPCSEVPAALKVSDRKSGLILNSPVRGSYAAQLASTLGVICFKVRAVPTHSRADRGRAGRCSFRKERVDRSAGGVAGAWGRAC